MCVCICIHVLFVVCWAWFWWSSLTCRPSSFPRTVTNRTTSEEPARAPGESPGPVLRHCAPEALLRLTVTNSLAPHCKFKEKIKTMFVPAHLGPFFFFLVLISGVFPGSLIVACPRGWHIIWTFLVETSLRCESKHGFYAGPRSIFL